MMALDPIFLSRPFAHRGLFDTVRGIPENSLAAAEEAISHGYGIECDLQLSADGQAMVFHDDNMERLTPATGHVRDYMASELKYFPLIGGEDGMPTLVALLDLVDGQVPLLIEIKDQDGQLGPEVGMLEESAAHVLRNYKGPAAVMSFNPNSIAAFQMAVPGMPVGLVTDDFTSDHWGQLPNSRRIGLTSMRDLDRLNADFISHNYMDLASSHVATAKQAGRSVLCWTVRSKAEEKKARKWADNVTFEGYFA